jgi:hypothetical protein
MEISVKLGKDSTSTLSLIIQRARLKNYLQKSTLTFKEGWVKLRKPSILVNSPKTKTAFAWPTQLIGPHVAYTTFTIFKNIYFPKYLFI